MTTWLLLPLTANLLVAQPAMAAVPAAPDCGLPKAKWVGELQQALSRRAVEIIKLAAGPSTNNQPALTRLIDPSAEFRLGSGDVDRSLGTGVAGARKLASEMNADAFRFLGWDHIPAPVENLCGALKVDVDFVDGRRKYLFQVTFEFEAGRIVGAKGWTRSFETGTMDSIRQ